MKLLRISAMSFLLLFNGVLLLGFLSLSSLPAAPGGGAGAEVSNGDVNGDGSLNISDAVYLLRHMFSGGPQPVACAQDADLSEQILAKLDEIATKPSWPPRPEDLVTITATGREQEHDNIAFTVPEDRVFVLMKISTRRMDNRFEVFQGTGEELVQRWGERSDTEDFDPGLPFPPNSDVVLRLEDPSCGGDGCRVRYSLIGYLVDAPPK